MESRERIKQRIAEYYDDYYGFDEPYFEWASRFDIKDTTLFVLERIYFNRDHCTQKYLCDHLSYPKQTISAVLNRLEKDGKICKAKDPEDLRGNLIRFTEEGLPWAAAILEPMKEREIRAFEHLTEEQRDKVNEGLHLLATALEWAFREENET